MEELEGAVRRVLSGAGEVRYAIVSLSRGLLASNMVETEARSATRVAELLMPYLEEGDVFFRRTKSGETTLLLKASDDVAVVLGGLWAGAGELEGLASSIRDELESLGELAGAEDVDLASALPTVAWSREARIRLSRTAVKALNLMDGWTSVAEIARELGLSLAEACRLTRELSRMGAIAW